MRRLLQLLCWLLQLPVTQALLLPFRARPSSTVPLLLLFLLQRPLRSPALLLRLPLLPLRPIRRLRPLNKRVVKELLKAHAVLRPVAQQPQKQLAAGRRQVWWQRVRQAWLLALNVV